MMSSSEEFRALKEANVRIENSISKLADAMTELVRQTTRSEEKHEQTEKTMQRLGNKIDKLEDNQKRLELRITSNSHVLSIGTKLAWLVIGSGVSGAIATLFYFVR